MNYRLAANDKALVALADPNTVINALSRFRTLGCPPWLPATYPYQDGVLPKGAAAFAAISAADMLEAISVRGPLHAIDGWSYLGRAFSALMGGQAHAARHLCYYAELRAALSILASSGIGVFNRQNAVIDATCAIHIMSDIPTHDMTWLVLAEWSALPSSMERLVKPVQLAGVSFLEPFREFFPAQTLTAASELMQNLGFDLRQGAEDRIQRNWSSYQPTVLAPIVTSPAEDAAFLRMFWNACRPNGVELERHLLRRVLETQARIHNLELSDYEHSYARLQDGTKAVISFNFLTRVDGAVDHDFLLHVANSAVPAHPYAMMCRAGLLLRLATGMAEENLRAAGVQPYLQFNNWWQDFGTQHGLWQPGLPPESTADLWDDIDLALEEGASAPTGHRHEWISGLGGNAMRICETERAALWGLFQ